MRCRKALNLLALHAGGDLPELEIEGLLAHLEHCASCRAELARLKAARALLERIAAADIPEPLPADFSRQILLNVLQKKTARPSLAPRVIKFIGWKPALALGTAALTVLLAWGPVRDMLSARTGFFGMRGRPVRQTQTLNPGEIIWGAKIKLIGKIEGPSRLSELEPPDEPGIYAVLHRPDPRNRPDVFAVDYIGQSSRLSSPAEYLWLYKRKDILLTRAGSIDSLFVVFYPMPESNENERLELRNSLVARFEPYLTDQGGV
jgi:hypothetical protein